MSDEARKAFVTWLNSQPGRPSREEAWLACDAQLRAALTTERERADQYLKATEYMETCFRDANSRAEAERERADRAEARDASWAEEVRRHKGEAAQWQQLSDGLVQALGPSMLWIDNWNPLLCDGNKSPDGRDAATDGRKNGAFYRVVRGRLEPLGDGYSAALKKWAELEAAIDAAREGMG